MKNIELIPYIYAGDFSDEMLIELIDREINTHYQNDVFSIDWKEDKLIATKQWLLETYGEVIKNYDTFAIQST